MIRKDAKLVKNLFAPDLPAVPTRDGYGRGVVQVGKNNPHVVVVCADLTDSTRNTEFKKHFPERFIEIGVQEQLLVALAAGLALAGKIPYVTSYATFCPGRAWEQIRTNLCLNNANVKVIGSHAGVSVGPDGASHQATEDIASLRPIPNMIILAPCDSIESEKATLAVAKIVGPCYLRFAREKTPVFTTPGTPFKIGQALVLRDGKDAAIVACGPLVYHALKAAEELSREKIEVMVINSHTIKPLDEKTILAAAKKCGALVTVEEHQITGGLGGAVAEYLARVRPTPMEFIGVPNRFGESGEPGELIESLGMGVNSIKTAIKKVIKKK